MRLQGGNKETEQNVWEEYEFYILNGDIENLSHLVELKILDIDVKEIPTILCCAPIGSRGGDMSKPY